MNLQSASWRKKGLAVLMLSALLTVSACSGGGTAPAGTAADGGSKPNEQTPQASAAPDAAQKPAGTVEINVWDQPKADDPMKPALEEIFAAFDQEHPEIKVTHTQLPTGTNDRQVFVTSMAGGNGPDAYPLAHMPIIGDWVKQGLALDLTPYWQSYADKDQFLPSAMQSSTIDGKVYGVPNTIYIAGLLWNKSLFKDAGLDPNKPPANWDELVTYAQKLTNPDKKQFGLTLLGMEWADWWFEYYVWQAGGDLTEKNPDGTVKLTFTDEPTVKALQFYKDLKWKHKVVQNNVVQSYQDNLNDLYQGRAAMSTGFSSGFGDYVANGLDLNNLGFAPFPVGPSGKGPSQMGGEYWIINPKISKEKQDAAWTYISYVLSQASLEHLLKFQSDNGLLPNLLPVRKDVDPTKYTKNIPQELKDGVLKAAGETHLEYYMKERLTPYVVKAVQKVLVDQGADPAAALKEAQDAAQKEVIDPYNAELKK